MPHVTLKQALKLKERGYPQDGRGGDYRVDALSPAAAYAPSAEELMEWLKERIELLVGYRHIDNEWHLGDHLADAELEKDFHSPTLIDALFQAACWVLEGKK